MIGASGLSDDDDGKNDGLKWKLAESVRYSAIICLSHFVAADEAVLKYYSQTGRLTASVWGGG
jgi:hypothetical protein